MTRLIPTASVLVMLALLQPGGGLAADGAALRAFVRPSFAVAPAVVRIEALVEPAAQNHSLEVVIDSGGFYRSSTIELDGADAARAFTVEFRAVPEGSYEVLVALRRGDGRPRATESYRVEVVGSGA